MATYWVDPAGTATTCIASTSDPGLSGSRNTIASGASCLVPGDTLMIKAGTYVEALIDNIPGGTSWTNSVLVTAFGSDIVRIKPASGNFVIYFSGLSRQYIEFRNIILDGTNIVSSAVAKITYLTNQLVDNAHHIRFNNVEFIGNPTVNCLLGSGSGVEVINGCNLHNGAYAVYWGGDTMLIEKSWFHNNTGYGLHFFNLDQTTLVNDNIVRYNLIEDNGAIGSPVANAMIFSSGSRNLAHNNIIKTQINGGGGVQLDFGAVDSKIYNNTIYGNAGPGISVGGGSGGAILKNNIVFNNGSTISNAGIGTVETNNLFTNPLFYDPLTDNFNVLPGSAAIDAGIAIVGFPFLGSAPDIGCFEQPLITSAVVENLTPSIVTMNFAVNVVPILPSSSATGFNVKVNGVLQTISSSSRISNTRIDLTIGTAIIATDTVLLSYTGLGNVFDSTSIRTQLNGALRQFTDLPVTNNVLSSSIGGRDPTSHEIRVGYWWM